MPENNGRKVVLTLLLLIGAALLILVPDRPFRMGLDLEGGTRIVYSVDFQKALDEGKINAQQFQNKGALMAETIGLVRERIDPEGVLEPRIYPEGEERFVVEIPGIANLAEVQADLPLDGELRAGERSLKVLVGENDQQQLLNFPASGGVIRIGDTEQIRYDSRIGNEFLGLRRGVGGTQDTDHGTNEIVHLVSNDPIKSRIENPGSLKFYIGAQAKDWPVGTDEVTERNKVTTWVDANPGVDITVYNRTPYPEGPAEGIAWFPMRETEAMRVAGQTLADRLVPLAIPKAEWNFTGTDLEYVGPTWDDFNLPAIALQLKSSRSPAFSDFTTANVNQLMAIVISDEIASLATIQERLAASFRITGQFTQQEVNSTVQVLRSGSLTYDVQFEEEERVGPTLGERYIKQGSISVLLAFLVVLGFIVVYYRKLGIFAAISLLCNLLLLMGAMAFMQATLTLPGVAGIILTVGMAVDANILIYERIREEQDKGAKSRQAVKDGFGHALSTIVDANVTTLITAIILGYVGTGPVRGFATTLSVGILTSMFSALVITRLLVDFSISKQKQSQPFSMARLIGKTEVSFMSMSKTALLCSLAVIIGGLVLLSQVPSYKLFSIDFLGGSSLVIRTEKAEQTQTVRDLVATIDGAVGEHSEVSPLIDSGSSENGYRQFRITYKNVEGDAESGGESTTEGLVKEKLESILQHGPVVVETEGTAVTGRLYFENPHPQADLVAKLTDVPGLKEPAVTEVAGDYAVYDFTGTTESGNRASGLVTAIGLAFEGADDSAGDAMVLAQPVPEISSVGAQIVGELRDNAILAIFFSLFAVVLYIRMRFAEYSYGFAAVAALVHDVLITLGVLAVAIDFNLVAAELSLPMVAAFLTIIGYSLNDTIVVFDRIRENRPRMKGDLKTILDTSINQTLARTLLTSVTTLIAVVILFAFNYGSGSLLEGFAFALTIGVLVGTYSSIFVASPVLLFLETRNAKRAAAAGHHAD